MPKIATSCLNNRGPHNSFCLVTYGVLYYSGQEVAILGIVLKCKFKEDTIFSFSFISSFISKGHTRVILMYARYLRHTCVLCMPPQIFAAYLCVVYAANICGIYEYDLSVLCISLWEWKEWKNNVFFKLHFYTGPALLLFLLLSSCHCFYYVLG